MSNMQIAQTILSQLGGGKFRAMTGAKDFVAIDNGLQFGLPGRFAKDGINKVRVTLGDSDLYTVEFLRCYRRGLEFRADVKAREEGICCDMLQDCFKRATGLDTHL